MNEQIAVSIICNAYNHEPFIAKCLDGFVMQKTNFVFEILVHDDASTDNTANIIREYEAKYPQLVKPVYQTENQYSKGGISQFQYPRVQGKYIALCEGDDFWTDPLKLQKQYDAMEAHPELDICAHAAQVQDLRTGKTRMTAPRKHDGVIPVEEVILGGGGFVATNSIFYRAAINQNKPLFRQQIKLDYGLQIHGSLRGGMLYLSDCMSTYRFMTPGSWTQRNSRSLARSEAHSARIRQMLGQLDVDTDGRYQQTIRKMLLRMEFTGLKRRENYRGMLDKQYKECMARLSPAEKMKIYLKAYFPVLIRMKKRMDQSRQG